MERRRFVKYHLDNINMLIDSMLNDTEMSLLEYDVLKEHLINLYNEVIIAEKSVSFDNYDKKIQDKNDEILLEDEIPVDNINDDVKSESIGNTVGTDYFEKAEDSGVNEAKDINSRVEEDINVTEEQQGQVENLEEVKTGGYVRQEGLSVDSEKTVSNPELPIIGTIEQVDKKQYYTDVENSDDDLNNSPDQDYIETQDQPLANGYEQVQDEDVRFVQNNDDLSKNNTESNSVKKSIGWRDVMFDANGVLSEIKQENHVNNNAHSAVSDFSSQRVVTVGDKMTEKQNTATIGETIGNSMNNSTLGTTINHRKLQNIKDAIDINDKFFFIKNLFDDDVKCYNETIDKFNSFTSLNDAKIFLQLLINRYNWSYESDAYKKFEDIIERRFE